MDYKITNMIYRRGDPMYCLGTVECDVNGEHRVFNGDTAWLCFWRSGGDIDYENHKVIKAPWQERGCLVEKELRHALIKELNRILPPGCCGECLGDVDEE